MLYYLMLLADKNDQAEFEAFYMKNNPTALRIAKKYFRDPMLAENAVHDAFCTAAENFQKISGKSCQEQASYFVKVVRSRCVDSLRRERKHRGDEEYSEELTIPFSRIKAEQKLQEVKADVSRAVEVILELPPIYRDVLECRLLLEMSNKETAKELEITEDACSQRFKRGRKMVADALTKEGIHT